MDDQGAGGSSRGSDTSPERRQFRESSLPSTLLPHLYHAPRDSGSQRIAPLMGPDWSNRHARSRSQDPGRSLPSPSHLLPADIDDPTRSGVDRRYSHPPISRSTSASPSEPHRLPYPRVLPYGLQSTSRTPQPPRPRSIQAGISPRIRDVFIEDVGVLPQPEMPVRPLGNPYADLGRSPAFSQEQRRGGSEVRVTHTSRPQRNQIQTQDHRQSGVEGLLRDPQRQVEPFSSQPIRGTRQFFLLVSTLPVYGVSCFGSCDYLFSVLSLPVPFPHLK